MLAELGVGPAEAAALERDGVVASAGAADQTER
jgi:hypothetical protein